MLAKTKKASLLILIFAVLAGAFLRTYNLNWDRGYSFHPDERNISASYARINIPKNLNPKFFAYGSAPIYLYRLTGQVITFLTSDTSYLNNWGKINVIGRAYSSVFSTLLIVATYYLAKRLFTKNVALLSALIVAFTAAFIQLSHFSITESAISLFAVSACFVSCLILEKGERKHYFVIGLLLGIATAFKTSSLSLFIFPLTAHTLRHTKNLSGFLSRESIVNIFLLASVSLFTFAILSPYTFISWNKFMESMNYESKVVSGKLPVPYTLQFTNTLPYIFQLKNLFWQMGPVALVAIAGYILLWRKIVIEKSKQLVVFAIFPILYFVYVGSWFAKFIRYMTPIIPFLIISSAFLLMFVRSKQKTIGNILTVIFSLFTIWWGLSFFSIYTKPQTRIQASKYIYENVPEGSRILQEHWDDGLPVNLSSELSISNFNYDVEPLTIYDPDSTKKATYYAENLSSADYLVLSSRRLYGTLVNLKKKYPLTSHYYELLFSEKLGFQKIAEFRSQPTLFGISVDDSASEETFQVYDHPTVIIFKNNNKLSAQEIENKLLQY